MKLVKRTIYFIDISVTVAFSPSFPKVKEIKISKTAWTFPISLATDFLPVGVNCVCSLRIYPGSGERALVTTVKNVSDVLPIE